MPEHSAPATPQPANRYKDTYGKVRLNGSISARGPSLSTRLGVSHCSFLYCGARSGRAVKNCHPLTRCPVMLSPQSTGCIAGPTRVTPQFPYLQGCVIHCSFQFYGGPERIVNERVLTRCPALLSPQTTGVHAGANRYWDYWYPLFLPLL